MITASPKLATSVNDHHSGLNPTELDRVVQPHDLGSLSAAISEADALGLPLIASGRRGAMGGQQFREGGMVIDCLKMARVLSFDRQRGLLEVESGITWPAIQAFLDRSQANLPMSERWAIRQKQTGADRLSIGGAVSANIHGRGLAMALSSATSKRSPSWAQTGNCDAAAGSRIVKLFSLVVGGYGLFGVIHSVTLRLGRLKMLRREVQLTASDQVVDDLQQARSRGALYGDFQFQIDPASPGFLRSGILSSYRPVGDATPTPDIHHSLSPEDWYRLIRLAHTDKSRAFAEYSAHYLRTDGQIYRSDQHQFTTYLDGYHQKLDHELGHRCPHGEMITELYVPRDALPSFLDRAAQSLRRTGANPIYGIVRLIEAESETALAWARRPWACVILNLCVGHDDRGVSAAKESFTRLIDDALEYGGSYYLTYHRWASPEQLLAAHPNIPALFAAKRRRDPDNRIQSDWWMHYGRA